MSRKNMGILSLYLSLVIFTHTPTVAAEVQFAQVRASAAVAYADVDLLAPIGYFPAGSTIKVGTVFRKYGQVLPTAVSGHLAFVRVEDLILPLEMASLAKQKNASKTSGPRDSIETVETMFQLEDRLQENNYLMANFALASASDYAPKITNYFHNSGSKEGIGVQLFFKHRAPFKKFHWGPGLGYYRFAEEKTIFHYPTIEFQFSYRILQLLKFSLELLASGHGSFDARFNDYNQKYLYTASLYGYTYGAQLLIRPYQRWGGAVGISSQRTYFANMRARKKSPDKLDQIFKEVVPFNNYLLFFSAHLRL